MRLGLGLGLVRLGKAIASFVRDGLKLYYPFKDNSPELLLSGATSFDGSNDYISVPQTNFGANTGTLSFWCYGTNLAGNGDRYIIGQQDEDNRLYARFNDADDNWYIGLSETFNINTSISFEEDKWLNAVIVYNSGSYVFYIDGVEKNSGSYTNGSGIVDSNGWKIGSYIDGSSPWNGSIANVGIWNRALSSSEIESIYWKGQYADLKGTELTNLVSWYNLSADANDSTGTNNGTNNGATFLTDAYSASSPFLPRIQDKATPKGAVALASGSTSFAGNDYITLPNPLNYTNHTISVWTKITDDSTGKTIIDARDGGNDGILLWYNSSENVQYFVNNSNILSSNTYNGEWIHIAATYDGTTQKLYINGSLDQSTSTSQSVSTTTNSIIGARSFTSTANYYNGSMANVAIYSDAKTQSQIQDIMFSSYSTLTSALKTNLVSWYDLGSTGFGSELVTNGTFDSGITGWSSHNYTTAYQSDPIGGKSNVLKAPNSGAYSRVFPSSGNLVVGKTYKLTFEAYHDTSSADGLHLYLNTGADSQTTISASPTGQVWASFEKTFTATTTNFGIGFDGSATDYFDNISVKEIQAPDSQGDNEGSIYGATTNTGYTSSPSGVADPLNYGEVYGGNAVSFDGTNDYISVADNDSLSFGDGSNDSAFSISAWVNMDDATSFPIVMKGIYNSNAEWHLWTQGDDKLYIVLYDESVSNTYEGANTSAITSYEGKWTHITATYDGTGGTSANNGLKIYINGSSQSLTLIGSGTYVAMENLGANVEIGRTGSTYADGKINNVKIFSEALTQDQVRELYTKPELTLPTGIASSALKLDMPMQEGSGVAILDGSGNQNHGTGSGITWANGQEYGFQHPLVRSNNPMVFDGGDDHVDVVGFGNIFGDNYAGSLTASMWVKIDDTSQNQGVLNFTTHSNTSSVFSVFVSANQLFYYLNVSGYRISNSFTSNDWNHIVAVYDTAGASGTKLYLNGSEIGTHAGTFPSDSDMDFAGLKLVIGSYYNPSLALHGIMNEVAIWDSALTANEVTALYNSGLPLLPTTDSGNYASSSDLVGYWRNDGVTTWTDRSTNSNNGTVSGSPASIIVPEGLNEGRDSQGYYLTDTDSISSGIRLKGAEYISVQDSESLSFGNGTSDSPFSLEAWVKLNEVDNASIITKGVPNTNGEWRLTVQGNDSLEFLLMDESVTDGYVYAYTATSFGATYLNQWIHVCATYDGRGGDDAENGMKVYVNSADATHARGGSTSYVAMENLGADVHIGREDATYLDGSIDEVKVYDKELSATEVLKNYNNGKSAHSN